MLFLILADPKGLASLNPSVGIAIKSSQLRCVFISESFCKQAIIQKENLTIDDIEFIYENYDPGYDTNVTEKGVYFTPMGLAQDFALMAPKSGLHIVDLCGGIGMLSYQMICMSYYHKPIKSITVIELNKTFCDMGKRLLEQMATYNENIKWQKTHPPIQINYINGSMFDKNIWTEITSTLPDMKFDLYISNPPYGKVSPYEKEQAQWLNYSGERELMALELAQRYSKHAHFVLPPCSCEFMFSGRPYYERKPQSKVERFKKANPDMFFFMEADGIDCSIYKDDWKGTSILTEVASICFDKNEY